MNSNKYLFLFPFILLSFNGNAQEKWVIPKNDLEQFGLPVVNIDWPKWFGSIEKQKLIILKF
jgi:hypothetical protein